MKVCVYSYPQYILKYVVIMTALCISHCPVIYREEDLLDIAPLLAENSRLGNTLYISMLLAQYDFIVYMKGCLDWALIRLGIFS